MTTKNVTISVSYSNEEDIVTGHKSPITSVFLESRPNTMTLDIENEIQQFTLNESNEFSIELLPFELFECTPIVIKWDEDEGFIIANMDGWGQAVNGSPIIHFPDQDDATPQVFVRFVPDNSACAIGIVIVGTGELPTGGQKP